MQTLKPFTTTEQTNNIHVTANIIHLDPQTFSLHFCIQGAVNELLILPLKKMPERKNDLWKSTCLEAFLSTDDNPESPYLEINCSPNGNWNAYRFSKYREGMQPCPDCRVSLEHVHGKNNEIHFHLQIKTPDAPTFKKIGLTAVLEFTNANLAYYALNHPSNVADFHNKQGFSLNL